MNREVAGAAAVGAAITLLDRMHWSHGVLAYGAPGLLWGQPLWVPFLFAAAAVALMLAHRWMVGFRLGYAPAGNLLTALGHTGVFALAYACTAVFHRQPVLLTIGLVAAWLPVALAQRYAGFVTLAVAAAVLGPLVESAIVGTGAFRYLHPDLGRVPMWLPALYLWAAYCGAGLDRGLR